MRQTGRVPPSVEPCAPTTKENLMRTFDCVCGQRLHADDDEALETLVRAHLEQAHPRVDLGDDEIQMLLLMHARNTDAALDEWRRERVRSDMLP